MEEVDQLDRLYNQSRKIEDEIKKENKELLEALDIKKYCKYANKCNEFNDCTREEYQTMAERNMKLCLENDEFQQELDKYKAKDYSLRYAIDRFDSYNTISEITEELLDILDKE